MTISLTSFAASGHCSKPLGRTFGGQALLVLLVVFATTFVRAQSLQEPVQPVNIILDDDMSHNADDTGDHAMLWAMAARGEANVLALIISSTNDYSAPTARAIARYYGHPNIPIGANLENIPNDYAAYFSYYTQQVATQFGTPGETRFNYPDAVTVYRQALANAPDHSVYIVSGGYYRPMMRLLQSSGDAISPLTGLQLVAQKVKRLIIVAGSFPDSGTTDRGNMLIDPDSGSYVVANWPVEIVWMPDDQAWDVTTGPAPSTDPNTNPIARSYQLYCNGGGSAPDQAYCANSTPGWTQLGLLYAVRGGLGTNFVAGGRDGSTVVWTSSTSEPGRIIWSQSPDRDHSYLLKNVSGATMMSYINPLLQWIPSGGTITQPPVANSQSVTVPGSPSPITLTATDPQGAALTYQVVTNPSHGVLSGTAPNLTYTPTVGYTGPDSFTFTASNAVYTSNTAVVSVTVSSNQAPVANSQTVTSSNGASVQVTLTATDPNGDPLTYSIVTPPQHGSLSGTPPLVTYSPTPGFSGSDSFTFVASDGQNNSNVATVAITVTLSSGLQEPVEPVNLIMDSDLAHGADDAGDHAMLWALAARSEVNVLALIISSTNDYSAPCAHAIASYYGHPNVLIGANLGSIPGSYQASSSAYTQQCTSQFGTAGDIRSNYPNAVTVYRQALANAPDQSVYIVNGGFYRPLYDLLQSGPDAISPLTGLQLVAQKVRRAVFSAGRFPDSGTSPEANLANDPDSASYVVANWPTELVWLGYDEGWNVITGPATTTDPATNPIALIYNLQCQNGTYCANNAPAWTQMALLYGVRGGFGSNFVAGGLDGSTVVWDSTTATPGRSIWSQTPNRQQAYLQRGISPTDMAAILNPLVQWTPTTSQTSTSVGLSSSLNPSTFAQAVTFTAVVSSSGGTPTGNVTFYDGSTALGTSTLSGGQAALATSALSVGTHTITATYAGGGSFQGSTSSALSEVVNRAGTSTALTSSPSPSVFAQTVTLTATVSATGSVPSGTVTFSDGGTALGSSQTNSSGVATLTVSTLAVGTHSLTAAYAGGGNWLASTSAVRSQTVNRASSTTTLTSSVNPSLRNQSVTFTAVVTTSGGVATGTVQFRDGTTTLATVTLNASARATFTTSSLAVGSHTMRAVYSGDTRFQSSTSSSLTQRVTNSTTTTLTSSRNPSLRGQTVTFTATVTSAGGVPTGTVTFRDGNVVLGSRTLNTAGQASFSTSSLSRGSHSITAAYGGATTYMSSTSATLVQQVN